MPTIKKRADRLALMPGRVSRCRSDAGGGKLMITRRPSDGGKYAPLGRYLASAGEESATLSFGRIESILGTALPRSAATHRAWWDNEIHGGHVQARAWMSAGWRVTEVNLGRSSVTFSKEH